MIEILDSNLKKIDILRKYTMAQYDEKFRDVGEFEINAKFVDENKYLLDKNKTYFVLFDNTVFGKIEQVKKESEEDADYENNIKITGRLSKYILTKRVVNGRTNYKGNTVGLIEKLITENITKYATSKRYINITIVKENPQRLQQISSSITKEITGGYLWESIQPLLEQDRLGIKLIPVVEPVHTYNGVETNISKWTLTISAGEDRRDNNTDENVPVKFSQSFSNIKRANYNINNEEYRNVAYIAGEGEGDERKWYEIYRSTEAESKTGWNREELWIDARDIQSEGQDEDGNTTTLTPAEYDALIQERTNEKFEENNIVREYGCTVIPDRQYKLGVHYFNGDYVTVIDNELLLTLGAQVIGTTKTWQDDETIIDIELENIN